MANRHLFRSIVLQVLFELDIHKFSKQNFKEIVVYNIDSFSQTTMDDSEKILKLIKNIVEKKDVLDEIIEKATPNWTISKMTIVDRNILRIGMYELIFGDKELIPEKVAINEAVELAKKFGGPKSGNFVNGVIGAVYRELGEPGKDFISKKKYDDIDINDMEIDKKGAAVVYSIDKQNVIRIGMVHDIFGYWTLPKGGIEEEDIQEGTIRKIKEETNWDIKIEEKLGENEYIAYHPERGPVRKQVTYFLGKSAYTKPILEKGTGGLDDVRWFDLSQISDLNIYDDVSKMLIKTFKIIIPDIEKEKVDEGLEKTDVD